MNKKKGWMGTMAIDWAHFGDCNACTVDWSRLANYDYAKSSVSHTKLVSNAISSLMNFLNQNGMKIDDVSIAGHSLGAQIAGYVGAMYSGKIAAIYGTFFLSYFDHLILFSSDICVCLNKNSTGLDPAGPGFTAPIDYGNGVRLDSNDAKYVQCIYTNNGVLGTSLNCGHGNFIMNGGLAQPGCFTAPCAHSRATEYFTESLNPEHKFVSKRCENLIKKLFFDFIAQQCSYEEDRLGIHSARKKGSYFVRTNSYPPYARSTWKNPWKSK